MDKPVEHYGVLLGESVIWRVTVTHARHIFEADALQEEWPTAPGTAQIIAEMDGSMVPIMEPERQSNRDVRWHARRRCVPSRSDSL